MLHHLCRSSKRGEEKAGGKAANGPEESLQVGRRVENQASGARLVIIAGALRAASLLPCLPPAPVDQGLLEPAVVS